MNKAHAPQCTNSFLVAILLSNSADTLPLQGFACQDIKLENVLLVNDAGTLVKLCISGCSPVRF